MTISRGKILVKLALNKRLVNLSNTNELALEILLYREKK
jgi:hypothetical protein